MSNHTKGPWRCAGGAYVNIQAGRHLDGTFRNIAAVGIIKAHTPTDDECEANARLIAAAPDLLTTLKKLLSNQWIAGCIANARADHEDDDLEDYACDCLELIAIADAANAAIPKAEQELNGQ